ncbi:hypothetical protein ACH5RR_012802 [Cinchona calisaya]|uniref:Uncharacterized protein n=1 Tax=Cinchona calisaya TaxID=153742 RepID=A0ABD3AB59_9GENT
MKKFSLSLKELEGTDLGHEDVQRVVVDCQKSLIGKVIREKLINYVGGGDRKEDKNMDIDVNVTIQSRDERKESNKGTSKTLICNENQDRFSLFPTCYRVNVGTSGRNTSSRHGSGITIRNEKGFTKLLGQKVMKNQGILW